DDLAAVATGRAAVADVVVELLGGLEPAGELITAALDTGAAVVTANKALLARRGAALEGHVRRLGGTLRFEAAVGGGLPVLGPLGRDLAADRWHAITGIVNGTTNDILCRMDLQGASYGDALAGAQAAGYAEADPSGDVEGRDAADKLAVLIRFAFGAWPDVTAIRRAPPALDGDGPPGITGVTEALLRIARRDGLVIRLVAHAERAAHGTIAAWVMPAAVGADSGFGRTEWVDNRLELDGEPVGRVTIGGPGAGGPATSSAVLGDLLAIARGEGSTWAGLPPAPAAMLQTVDDLGRPRRWLIADPPGDGFTSLRSVAQLRTELRGGGGYRATLFPILDEAR
ncbi:MAG TPA: homoserine dehydrogenase, partial [Candidatus Baltobacteraceae bacterium]|nr:homoserine dehydrogenase [Candidatus Baltobacteraceae bacterium]